MIGRSLLFTLLIPLLLHGAGDASLSFATWNLQNFLLQDRYEEGHYQFAYPLPEKRKERIRQLILEARADVLFLQEMGSSAFLKELQLDLAASGLDYPYARFSGQPDTSRGLAVLSRIPPAEVLFHDPLRFPGNTGAVRRGIQEVRFIIQGETLRFFHLHLKSRYTSDEADPQSRLFREAELQTLVSFLRLPRSRPARHRLFLLGDFNTPFDSPMLASLKAGWNPLPASDDSGAAWTYLHRKSASRETIDGVWIPRGSPVLNLTASLLPAGDDVPSDHRMVLVRWEGTDEP